MKSLTADVLKTESAGADLTFDISLSPSWTLLELNRWEIEMARPSCIEYAGALYHLTARGNARANIYANDDDGQRFFIAGYHRGGSL